MADNQPDSTRSPTSTEARRAAATLARELRAVQLARAGSWREEAGAYMLDVDMAMEQERVDDRLRPVLRLLLAAGDFDAERYCAEFLGPA